MCFLSNNDKLVTKRNNAIEEIKYPSQVACSKPEQGPGGSYVSIAPPEKNKANKKRSVVAKLIPTCADRDNVEIDIHRKGAALFLAKKSGRANACAFGDDSPL